MLNIQQAMACYARAAELNHARSAHNLAILYLQSLANSSNDDRQKEAVRLLEQAASLGLKEVFLRVLSVFNKSNVQLVGHPT